MVAVLDHWWLVFPGALLVYGLLASDAWSREKQRVRDMEHGVRRKTRTVRIWVPCRRCSGTGRVESDGSVCIVCHGKGRYTEEERY